MFLVLACGLAAAQDLDLIAGTLNGEPVCDTALDDLTGMLGRPSGVEPARTLLSIELGPSLSWHPLGLSVAFEAEGEVGRELVRAVQVHVSRAWDSDHSEWFQVFPGTLTPAATANWRVQDSLDALAAHSPSERTLETVRRELTDRGIRESLLPTSLPHIVMANLSNDTSVTFQHEPVTRFLESVTFRCFTE